MGGGGELHGIELGVALVPQPLLQVPEGFLIGREVYQELGDVVGEVVRDLIGEGLIGQGLLEGLDGVPVVVLVAVRIAHDLVGDRQGVGLLGQGRQEGTELLDGLARLVFADERLGLGQDPVGRFRDRGFLAALGLRGRRRARGREQGDEQR